MEQHKSQVCLDDFCLIYVLSVLGTPAPSERLAEERISSDTAQEGSGSAIIHNPNASLSVEQQRQRLPVFSVCT
jgi:hypothetical protein